MGNLFYRQLTDVHESLDLMSRELMQIDERLDRIATLLSKRNNHADNR